ncbi:hypothetical protein [Chitinophaga agri]|uniref:DUF4231 domain-containing protein n=1 Tax=Chitinophaga agri TaxID=2703787 RepID=A0A6B9ZC91_9BACT|nr:hypothetical protein [Chitinophaga agri]QHS59960.1 hypothetical protein GWR21_10255 [Chitinophaga agri]
MLNSQISSARDIEALRQAREAFNQNESYVQRWFMFKMATGYAAISILSSIVIISGGILFNHSDFPALTVTLAGAALFTDALGIVYTVWKVILNPRSVPRLEPVIKIP